MSRRASLVRLTAPDERWVRRGALLLEDALRTVTIPGAGSGRVLLVRGLEKTMTTADMDVSLRRFLASLARVGLKVLLLVSVASMIGIETTSFIAVLGAAGLAMASDKPKEDVNLTFVGELGHREGGEDQSDERLAGDQAGGGQDAGSGTDFNAIARGRVAVTPLKVDLTRHEVLDDMRTWLADD